MGKAAAEERSYKLKEELRVVTEERDAVREDTAGGARELHVARASLVDTEKREKVVREVYGEMSASAYQSMLVLWAACLKLGSSLTLWATGGRTVLPIWLQSAKDSSSSTLGSLGLLG